jgi:hypothetical protein
MPKLLKKHRPKYVAGQLRSRERDREKLRTLFTELEFPDLVKTREHQSDLLPVISPKAKTTSFFNPERSKTFDWQWQPNYGRLNSRPS